MLTKCQTLLYRHLAWTIFFLIGEQLLYNVVLVSAVQQLESAIIIHLYFPSWKLFSDLWNQRLSLLDRVGYTDTADESLCLGVLALLSSFSDFFVLLMCHFCTLAAANLCFHSPLRPSAYCKWICQRRTFNFQKVAWSLGQITYHPQVWEVPFRGQAAGPLNFLSFIYF